MPASDSSSSTEKASSQTLGILCTLQKKNIFKAGNQEILQQCLKKAATLKKTVDDFLKQAETAQSTLVIDTLNWVASNIDDNSDNNILIAIDNAQELIDHLITTSAHNNEELSAEDGIAIELKVLPIQFFKLLQSIDQKKQINPNDEVEQKALQGHYETIIKNTMDLADLQIKRQSQSFPVDTTSIWETLYAIEKALCELGLAKPISPVNELSANLLASTSENSVDLPQIGNPTQTPTKKVQLVDWVDDDDVVKTDEELARLARLKEQVRSNSPLPKRNTTSSTENTTITAQPSISQPSRKLTFISFEEWKAKNSTWLTQRKSKRNNQDQTTKTTNHRPATSAPPANLALVNSITQTTSSAHLKILTRRPKLTMEFIQEMMANKKNSNGQTSIHNQAKQETTLSFSPPCSTVSTSTKSTDSLSSKSLVGNAKTPTPPLVVKKKLSIPVNGHTG